MIRTLNLARFSGVAPGGMAILNLPRGNTYDMISLEYVNGTEADITGIRVKINDRAIHDMKAGPLDYKFLNQRYGRAYNAACCDIWFQRPEMTTVEIERLTSIGTANLEAFTIELDIAASAAANFQVIPTALVSPQSNTKIVSKILSYYHTASAGLNDITSIVSGYAGSINGKVIEVPTAIAAMHFYTALDDITDLTLLVNGSIFWDKKLVAELDRNDARFLRTPIAKWQSLDFIYDGNHLSSMPAIATQDVRVQATKTAADAVRAMVEYFDTPGGIL